MHGFLSRSTHLRARFYLQAAGLAALAVMFAAPLAVRGQTPAPASAPTAFLGDVTSSTRAGTLNPDEARRLFYRTGPAPTAPREVTLPPSAERKRLSQLRETFVPTQTPETALRVRALEGFLDYDEEDRIIYSPGRTRIRYGTYFIEADKVILDARLQEAQAEGNVVMMIGTDKLSADSLRYNFKSGEGVAFNVSGEHSPVYFRPAYPKDKQRADVPQFQKVSKQESIFRDTNLTTCDFKVPHYNVRGREVVLFQGDRVFLRGATFFVWGVPVFYLPAYTRSLTGGSPWFMNLGYSSRIGAYVRFGYAYEHQTQEPSLENDNEYVTRSAGKAEAYVDYLSKIGPGLGFDYRYKFEYGRHRGNLSVYQIYDGDQEVAGSKRGIEQVPPPGIGYQLESPDRVSENERWRFFWQHRTEITPNMNLTVNVDQFSDPDLYYDILDYFTDRLNDRERQIQRRSRVALTDVEEAFVARLMFEIKDRIGINRYNNFSKPDDDNRDFDLNPFTSLDDADVDGIGDRRWGRVSERMPQFDLATRYLPMGNRLTYYMNELNLYNNLDKGLNVVSRNDDEYVKGAQFYNRLLRQWKLSERYTLIGMVGVGAGTARRNGEDLGIDDFTEIDVSNKRFYDGTESGVEFIDDDGTFMIGKRKRNLDQIKENYLWGDAELLFNAKISDALTGQIDWTYRKTTEDYIGDWYASLGNQTFREDLFNYPIRQHWLEGRLNYRLSRPLLSLNTRVRANLMSDSDLYSKEDIARWDNGFNWSNQRHTVVWSGNVGLRRQQLYDPTDPNAYKEDRFQAGTTLEYVPVHQRWYTRLRARYDKPLNSELEREDDVSHLTYFTERETDTDIKWIYGQRLGAKYNTEFQIRWDEQVGGIRDVAWLLQRDMHDAVASFRVQMRKEDTDSSSRTDSPNEFDYRFGLKFKLPNKEAIYGTGDVKTLRDQTRQPAVAY